MYEQYLSPVFSSLKGREAHISSLEKKFDSFKEWHRDILSSHQPMIELAKWYIRNHWEEVEWSICDSFEYDYKNGDLFGVTNGVKIELEDEIVMDIALYIEDRITCNK